MKIVIAIDAFKGSLTSIDAGNTIKSAILKVKPDADVIVKPMADGGEGTTDALIDGLNGRKVNITVTGPLGTAVNAYYGILPETNTAVMEMAQAAGITLISENQKNPFIATTYGVGEMILDACKKGCKNFIIGIGGSATNDGGLGMLKALGYSFLDLNGKDVGEGAKALSHIQTIDDKNVSPLLASCNFRIACDVNNPLYGPNGATYIYGPQKGVTKEQLPILDNSMKHFAHISSDFLGVEHTNTPGAGAAGGMGFAFLSCLNASLIPGIELIIEAVDLENAIKECDIVITGEGRLDYQTAMGKAPVGIARLAKKYNKKVIAFAGSVTEDAVNCNQAGIDAFFPINRGITSLEDAMIPENAKRNLFATVEQVFRIL